MASTDTAKHWWDGTNTPTDLNLCLSLVLKRCPFFFFLFNLKYYTLDKLSKQHTNNIFFFFFFSFFFFGRKQSLAFLLRRQFAWNNKPYFIGKITKKYFIILSVESFTQYAKCEAMSCKNRLQKASSYCMTLKIRQGPKFFIARFCRTQR